MKAQELIKDIESRLEDLGRQTESARHNEEVVEYLRFMGQFHRYSFHNVLSIYFHCPQASEVAGYKTWPKHGRFVKRGESGIPILAPCPVKQVEEADDGNQVEKKLMFFKVVYVFDVSQTDGNPLPEAPITATGDGRGLLPILEGIANSKGIHVEYQTLFGSHHGTSFGGRIEIDDRLDDAGRVSVICHEISHEMLHKGDDRNETTREQRETEAETVAYVVCSRFGIETKAGNYLALWNATSESISNTFSRIHAVAAELIESIESQLREEMAEVECVRA